MAFREQGRISESVVVEEGFGQLELLKWDCVTEVEDRYRAPHNGHHAGDVVRQVIKGNALVNRGGALIWNRLVTLKPSTTTTGAGLQAYSTGNARIGVGTSTAAAAVTQTDIQSTTKVYKGMESGYPATSTAASTAARTATFRALFSTAQGNFAWNELGIFNSTAASRSMLNRKVQSMGTKSSAATRQITITLSLA